jgi:hypothetical protein
MLEFSENGRPLHNADMDSVESQLNVRLPEVYRTFLLEFNGGRPSLDIVDIGLAPRSPTDVQVFFGIGRNIESSDLLWNARQFSGRLPNRDLLPIACDSNGNLFCLEVKEERAGRIFYCDVTPREPKQYLVSNSFDEFLDKLHAWVEPV